MVATAGLISLLSYQNLHGTGELVRVEPFRDRYGLDWRIVVTMPESEFEGPLRRDALTNLLISLGAVGVSGTLGMQAVRRVNASLTQVVEGSEALAEGNLDHEVPPGELAETQRVAMSLNTMASSLRASNAAVSEEVAQRTWELQGANQRLEEEIALRRRAEEELLQSNAELQVLAHTDRLTGVANRNQLDHQLAMEWQRHRREQKPIALLMIDADHFKTYNDCFGHLAGDRCLIWISEVVQRPSSRPGDLLARFGGEEFVLLLPNTDCPGAITVAERVQEALEHQAIPHPKAVVAGRVSVSIGIASQIPDTYNTPQDLLASADAALYRADAGGALPGAPSCRVFRSTASDERPRPQQRPHPPIRRRGDTGPGPLLCGPGPDGPSTAPGGGEPAPCRPGRSEAPGAAGGGAAGGAAQRPLQCLHGHQRRPRPVGGGRR
jgi:diguanylate cyclase (GGDEF)-like protein